MGRVLVRRHRPDDTAAAVEIDLLARTPLLREVPAAFEDDEAGPLSPDAHARREASLRRALEANESWVAVADGVIVGFVAVAPRSGLESSGVVEFAIDPRWRGQGVASALLARSRGLLQERALDLAG